MPLEERGLPIWVSLEEVWTVGMDSAVMYIFAEQSHTKADCTNTQTRIFIHEYRMKRSTVQ